MAAASDSPASAGPLPPLRTRTIPRSGETLPMVGLGTWQSFDVATRPAERAAAKAALAAFVNRGGKLVDSSPMYGSAETVVGELAAELDAAAQIFAATKVWIEGRAAGVRQMESSIAKMRPGAGTAARLDLMQVHNLVDADTHLATLREWKAAGRVRYIGVTHYHRNAHAALEKLVTTVELDFIQINYSIAEPEAAQRLLPAALDRGVAVIVNRPFAEGAMFSRVRGRTPPAEWRDAYGVASWSQAFLKWILTNPAVTCVIPGTRNAAHVLDNLAAATGPLPGESGTFDTSREAQLKAIVEAYRRG